MHVLRAIIFISNKLQGGNIMKYFIDYGTGAGNRMMEGTLEEAMAAAEKGLAHTQVNVTIYDENTTEIARLPWWGVAPEEDDIVTSQFGNGFFGEWQEL